MEQILEKLEPYWISILDRPDDLLVEEILKFYRYTLEKWPEDYTYGFLLDDYIIYPKDESIFEYIIGVKLNKIENSLAGDSEYNPGVNVPCEVREQIIKILFHSKYIDEIRDQCKLTKPVEL